MAITSLVIVTLILCYHGDFISAVLNLEEMTNCYVRDYRFQASKPFVTKSGYVLPCSDVITVKSCWGRCDSSEIADYKIPFKISNHPVCTYSGAKKRIVRLQNCHPLHPDPYYVIYDASKCACRTCNPEYISCENLNG
ncbi:hypothetical protein FSP39_016608 [Pinctada imbricata]|uniref:Glycoprotein hormone subunit beta domain-containing protein n=1 Tax=Pinctada imbricata TaxID=66713 RepID=A0AA88Y546_PINIB|nr:hypothetical protein FSP39_016608 [Pinctada imbricata]